MSEGRGTTRPFEIVGAPFLDGWDLAQRLNQEDLPGVYFRPIQFEPTFNKFAGQLCEGVFVHVTNRDAFRPVLTYTALLQTVIDQTGLHTLATPLARDRFVAASEECALPGFAWKQPPYEYEHDRMPIDILAGGPEYRLAIERGAAWTEFLPSLDEALGFAAETEAARIYPRPQGITL